MIYTAIGLMSGSSLDGLDIACVRLEEVRGKWSYEVIAAACVAYEPEILESLQKVNDHKLAVPEFLLFHSHYGHYLGREVAGFMQRHGLDYKVHFVASHGHTAFHAPDKSTSFQIGCGAAIAAECGRPVISDLRAMDLAFGGQGAPIVPIGDRLLFGGYDAWLNLGGIANITLRETDERHVAFDTCPCNQVLNKLAAQEGMAYDVGGALAAQGAVNGALLNALNALEFYAANPPKSLANEYSRNAVLPLIAKANLSTPDALATAVEHIAAQTALAINSRGSEEAAPRKLLATGGGALNTFLIARIAAHLGDAWEVVVPDEQTVQFKEAIVMALIGALRWREEANVLASATGARQDSIGGAIWMV